MYKELHFNVEYNNNPRLTVPIIWYAETDHWEICYDKLNCCVEAIYYRIGTGKFETELLEPIREKIDDYKKENKGKL